MNQEQGKIGDTIYESMKLKREKGDCRKEIQVTIEHKIEMKLIRL